MHIFNMCFLKNKNWWHSCHTLFFKRCVFCGIANMKLLTSKLTYIIIIFDTYLNREQWGEDRRPKLKS